MLALARSVAQRDHRKQNQPRQQKAARLHGKRTDIVHALALRDKTAAPDHGGQQKQDAALQLRFPLCVHKKIPPG